VFDCHKKPSKLADRNSNRLFLAQGNYNNHAFERMPELADTLAEVGCSNPDILSHCRGSGPHIRGCWVADLVLGKE
jgi:hypothetical protein